MIFFYGEGRLGNQIFQYQALCTLARPGELVVAVGLESLDSLFDIEGPRLKVLSQRRVLKRLVKVLLIPFILRPAARTLRLVNYVYEPPVKGAGRQEPGGEMTTRRGLLRRFTFVDGGYYQNPSLWPACFPAGSLSLKSAARRSARQFLDKIEAMHGTTSFVHVRRGDYLHYEAYGVTDICLPIAFYRGAIAELRRRVGKTHLLFITDDPRWVEENLGDITNKTIVSNCATMDFAVMSECKNGIISNSTFALAAALIMTNPGIVIAPEYWFGFRAGTWYPPRIYCAHAKMIYLPAAAGS